jgi:NTE family protein
MTDLTVVVDVNGPAAEEQSKDAAKEKKDAGENGVWDKLKDFVDGLSSDKTPSDNQPGLVAVMLRSLDTMAAAITRQQLSIFQPDLLVRIPKNACMVHEFHRAREVIDLGAELAKAAIENHRGGYPHAR